MDAGGPEAHAASSDGAGANRPYVTVVIPVYRNAATLEPLYDRLRATLEAHALSFEILFVDDACPEGSFGIIRSLSSRDPRVAGLALAENVGQHRAALAGLAHARGEWVVLMDADLQDPPEAIPTLLSPDYAAVCAVFAGRRGAYESPFRLLSSRLFKRVLSLLAGIPADAGLFVALRRPMVDRLLAFGGGRRPFLVPMIGCTGLPLASVPVVRAPRPHGSSAYSEWDRLRLACSAIASVLAWKLGIGRRRSIRAAALPAAKACVGARFAARASEPERRL